ncbi:peptidoglycan recognition protein family protein [Longibaculum muris]|uniref:peptidoglycan recognition protein family protein n=1 Tax=Longibaculum muris TaxID=1796628 RepID=UPI0022E6E7C7|nr:N-acetylmuramoyl-L-alanine amidase [Longibaculum muris]
MAGLTITKMLVFSEKYGIKCPYSMTPTEITYHETSNDASAMSEISYMIGNNKEVSYHYAVDDYRAVQGVLDNRSTWNSGDGRNGAGNRKSIAIECCYSKSGGDRYYKARNNALTLIALKMKQYGIPVSKVYFHKNRSGKNCPNRTLSEGITLAQFRSMVQKRYDEMYKSGSTTVKPAPSAVTKHKVGETVTINGVYTSSGSDKKLKPARTKGKITKVIKGARNPYLLENGNIGWTNDECITSKTQSQSSKSYYKKYTGKSGRVDVVLEAIGVPSMYRGSWKKRKAVANANGISGYEGTESQNNKIIALARQGKLKKV